MSEQLELAVEKNSTDASMPGLVVTPAWHGLLQHILHLAQFGGSVQVVCGSRGAGKSTFLDMLVAAEGAGQVVVSSASQVDGLEPFLHGLVGRLGLRLDDDASAGQLISALRGHVQNLEKERQRVIVAVDDAHRLDDSCLAALISVLQGAQNSGFGMHLIFLAEPGLAERVDAMGLLDVSVLDVYIPNFSPSELKTLLYEAYRHKHLPVNLTVDQVQRVWVQSGGLPGLALGCAQALVADQPRSTRPWYAGGWPGSHLAAVVILLAILAWAFLVRDPEPVTPNKAVERPEATTPVSERASDLNAKPAIAPDQGREPVQAVQPLPVAAEDSPEPEQKPLANADETPVNKVAEPVEEQSTEEPPSDSAVGPNLEPNVQDAIEVSEEPAPLPDTVPDAVDEATEPASVQQDSGTEVDEEQAPVVEGLDARVASSEEELLKLPESGYVLQLMALSKRDSLLEYMDGQTNRRNLNVYRRAHQGGAIYILVEGYYVDKQAASAAISNLPERQRRGGPWPKPISQVRAEISDYRSK